MNRIPIIPTIIVIAAAGVMVWLGFWQLGRADEKEAMIARYEAAQKNIGYAGHRASAPEAAYTDVIEYCVDPGAFRVTQGRNSKGESGWVHVARCTLDVRWGNTESDCQAFTELMTLKTKSRSDPDFKGNAMQFCKRLGEKVANLDEATDTAEVVLGWSRSPDPVDWSGGFLAGTVVPTGEFGFKIVAAPPLAGLEPNAKPDPKDLPNNHLAYAGQWFFFALTALLVYGFAVRSRMRKRG